MKKRIATCFIGLLICAKVLSGEEERRNISFTFYKSGVDKVEIVGDFGKNRKIAVLPMLMEEKNKWVIHLSIEPGFYCYRYFLNRKHWRRDPNVKEIAISKVGEIEGRFSVAEVYPTQYYGFIKLMKEFLHEGKKDWAVKVLIEASKKFPEKSEIYIRLGAIYEEDELYGFAADAYTAGIEKNPEDYKLRHLLALCYEKMFETTGKAMYKKNANKQWLILKKRPKYYEEAKQYLMKK
ncbi:MAG: hypothetical protein COZ72_01630 [Elusimicrobia bacterium CG_4_8_14_3_um_filter_50_9]|nr:MAG: hypothetical protein COZ72_01630 [Elusimicrobia bacterium CG_4_8_14_3_um_filter_50_9]